ncbi:MAG: TonB-dependent receptor [Rhodospirillaceae bacterium]
MAPRGLFIRALKLTAVVASVAPAVVRAQTAPRIEELTITANRLPPAVSEQLHNTTVIDRSALEQSGGARLDEILQQVPGFGLFRRQSSRASHPTTQGITLRGLGPSGAGRTLILLDGVPQNDPFGGWVDWSRLSPDALDSLTITRGGGAGAWGNTAMAGVVRLYRRADRESGGSARLRADSFGGYDGSATFRGGAEVQVFGAAQGHGGDGPYLIADGQRGAADVRTNNRGGWAELGTTFSASDTDFTAAANYSEDRLINGIGIARSRSKIGEFSLGAVHNVIDGTSWEAHAYVRRQGFNAVFAAVAADRNSAAPSLDQFRVPTTGAGGNFLVRAAPAGAVSVEAGADVRYATGATHELLTFTNGVFTRERAAGGKQTVAGAFAEVSWNTAPGLMISGSGRLDYWQQANGYRRELNTLDRSTVRNDIYADKDGTVASFRAGATGDLGAGWTARAVAYSGFRIPTLNELYRPFRVGNDITEANPALAPERLLGAEGGIAWESAMASWSFTLFHARLTDAVSNITVQTAPGQNAALNVFVPAGGVLRQRRNLDRITATGAETEARFRLSDEIELRAGYLYTAPKVRKAADQPALEGLRFAQVAKHQGSFSVSWRPIDRVLARTDVRAASSQFDDDQNSRQLRGYTSVDGMLEVQVTPAMKLFASAENMLGERIEAGLSATGLITVGNARVFALGTSFSF